MSSHLNCRICDQPQGADDRLYCIHEAMFGIGEKFDYQMCSHCGSLNMVTSPGDMKRYYPAQYYSFAPDAMSRASSLKSAARALLARYGSPMLFSGREWYEKGDLKSLRDARASPSMRILDLGCGSGALISSLRDIGFRKVMGADPFLAADLVLPNGTRIHKCDAAELDGPYDLVMMHHSLEHVWDQKAIVHHIHRMLAPGGRCIIRIPTVDCYAWEEYGTDWVQLDAPRHFSLHSRKSIRSLLEAAGFEVTALIDDSIAFHLLGSEKIRRGHALIDLASGVMNFDTALPAEFIAGASVKARELNSQGRGDAIAVHARKP